MKIIKGKEKISLLDEITTKQNKQLDHVLGIRRENILLHVTSFKNFISDHKAITIRISEPDSTFLSDPRLIDKDKR